MAYVTVLGWIFTIGALAHNAEKAFYILAWSSQAGGWYRPVNASVFRFAAIVLSCIFVAFTAAASSHSAGRIGLYLMAGYVLAMVLNVFMPHVIATFLMHKYMPGTVAAVFFNLPLGALYLHQAISGHSINPHIFYWAGPLIVVAITTLMPILFALGRKLHATTA